MCRASSTIRGPFILGMPAVVRGAGDGSLHVLEGLGVGDRGLGPLGVHGVGSDELVEHPAVGSV
jgi:hypothetical protein